MRQSAIVLHGGGMTLERAKGVTLEELMEATGWQAHSVRGFISFGV
jgi:hypothetical protein